MTFRFNDVCSMNKDEIYIYLVLICKEVIDTITIDGFLAETTFSYDTMALLIQLF